MPYAYAEATIGFSFAGEGFLKKLKPYFVYSLIGGGVMLASMLVGESIHGPIFNGFLHKPHLWLFALLETTVWVVPLTWLVFVFINKFSKIKGVRLVAISLAFWIVLSLCVFLIYQVVLADSRLPLLSEAKLSPPLVFGWYIPGAITIILFSILSPYVLRRQHN